MTKQIRFFHKKGKIKLEDSKIQDGITWGVKMNGAEIVDCGGGGWMFILLLLNFSNVNVNAKVAQHRPLLAFKSLRD